MRHIFLLCLLFLGFTGTLYAQDQLVQGRVTDAKDKQNLVGVTVYSGKYGTKTNAEGKFTLRLPQGEHTLKFSYTGYQPYNFPVNLSSKPIDISIQLNETAKELNTITVSGSRFEKRAAEEIVSIEVIKPRLIMSQGNNAMDDALQRVPGVDVIENQINIRGGSGWSYGAGSRVLVMVDDMPLMTGDAGDAKLDFLPLENCEQVEVLKGAASSLYGSSALNGVINFRTGFARNKPRTKAMLYNGIYGNPPDKSWKWWGKQQPMFQGGYLMHAQKFGNTDVVLGSAWYAEDSYLQGDLNRRARANMNLRHHVKNVPGLILGLNTNIQLNKSQTFFFWQPDSSNAKYLQPYGGLADSSTTINKNQGQRINIDPYLNYTAKNGTRHVLRTRWFRSKNDIPEKQQSSTADTYYGEYQLQKTVLSNNALLSQLHITAGLVGSFSNVNGELFGSHKTANYAPYVQLEKKFNRLWVSAGGRFESNHVDTYKVERKPVFRTGINYEVNQAGFLRASVGQGYRYPSIAERFVKTSFGASRVFPNPGLQSETGWTAELGYKQGFKFGNWMGYADVALFWTEFNNMMEFNFGLHLPPDSNIDQVNSALDYLGFKSKNIGNTRINGVDFSIAGEGKTGKVTSQFIFGYTYMNPIQVNPDSIIMANISGTTQTLKYRYRHTLKFDWESKYKKVSLGTTILYNSFMQNIDEVFANQKPDENVFGTIFQFGTGLPKTVSDFRNKYNNGTLVWDARIALQLTPQVRIAFITKNILNTLYCERPAIISPLRNFTLQLAADL
ncbi:MAG: TonB-dependent receptor [Chitinophagaceae bacterium]